VLDTSVLVSAALKPLGQPAMVIHSIALGLVELGLSKDVLSEYREVLARPKFARLDPEENARLLAILEAESTTVTPTEPLEISSHPSDNRFYECAAAAAADYIVTGNLKHFNRPYKGTKIITPRQLLTLLQIETE
jgi:putative PIN family toxin of toxin-antitoxin system